MSFLPRSRAFACALLALTVGFAAGCGDDEDQAVDDTATETDEAIELDQDEPAAESLDDLIGESVTVEGEVSERLDDNSAVVSTDQFGDVLVVEPGFEAVVGDVVRVEGAVEEFQIDSFSENLGVEFDAEQLEEFEGEPAVVADQTEIAEPAGAGDEAEGEDLPDEQFDLPEEEEIDPDRQTTTTDVGFEEEDGEGAGE